ncbi:hypothetical protein KIH27_15890 [Mycobacterium sp. M1]|uniref:Uncharacterized protein n=1 Tax=Mycolicibacter acidiphilus TaxID=2835306 RepID=A0ABS5RQ29_9MYCO|nr:hypothetical protein [Mycolicibacter acidiphilus]MBS9535069.1 hypothetical protein [Mycolicibacter acidiphilus]
MNQLTKLAHLATSPTVMDAAELVQRHIGAPNFAIWTGVVTSGRWLYLDPCPAVHVLLMGVRGTPTPTENTTWPVRSDNPWVALSEAVGSRRRTMVELSVVDALAMAKMLNRVATAAYPAPDLLALIGWRELRAAMLTCQEHGGDADVARDVLCKAASVRREVSDRLWRANQAFRADTQQVGAVTAA